jgi:hypothetical protein
MKPPLYLFGQEAKLKVFVGVDSSGDKVYGEITTLDGSVIKSFDSTNGEYTIKCRFEPNNVTSRTQQKDQKNYVGSIFTLGTDIPTQSTFIFEGNKYIVGQCIKHYSTTGISHLEVLLT